jgi:hypothetical protein
MLAFRDKQSANFREQEVTYPSTPEPMSPLLTITSHDINCYYYATVHPMTIWQRFNDEKKEIILYMFLFPMNWSN